MKEWICEEVPAVKLNGEVVSTMLHQVQELVRCKDCKYVDYSDTYGRYQCPKNKRFIDIDLFCADGERTESK